MAAVTRTAGTRKSAPVAMSTCPWDKRNGHVGRRPDVGKSLPEDDASCEDHKAEYPNAAGVPPGSGSTRDDAARWGARRA